MCAYFDRAEAERYFFPSFGRRAFQGRSFAELSVVAQILVPARLLRVWRHCRLLGARQQVTEQKGSPPPEILNTGGEFQRTLGWMVSLLCTQGGFVPFWSGMKWLAVVPVATRI